MIKISKKKLADAFADDDSVMYMITLPEKLHRFVKAEAALAGRKINDVVVEALSDWKKKTTKGV